MVKVDGDVDEIFALQDRIVVELGEGFERFATGAGRMARGAAPPAPPAGLAGRPPARRPGNGNGNGGGLQPPAPGAITPDGVTGGISIGEDTAPAVGIAAAAGILTGRPTVRPPRAEERPRIDGQLDDAVWQSAVRITDFVQQNPVEGAPATEDTDVYIAYDSQNVYFGIHAHYADPGMMRANRVDRDQAFRDDNISVYFDTFLDQQRGYVFSVNGYGGAVCS